MNSDRQLFKASSDVVILDDVDGKPVVWHTSRNWEQRLSRHLIEILQCFAVARTADSVYEQLRARFPNVSHEAFQEAVELLRSGRMLETYDPEGIRTPWGRGGMFGSPALTLSEILSGDSCRIVFLGVPYDLGVTHRPGCRFGPNYLRRASGAVFEYRLADGAAAGMYDPVSQQHLLPGVHMADAGDVNEIVFHRNADLFDNLEDVVVRLCRAQRFPVVLGGDHSISLPLIRGVASSRGELGILHFDAHSDFGSTDPDDWRKHLHHGNFLNWVVSDDKIRRVAQFGVRQLEHTPYATHDKIVPFPGRSATELTTEEIIDLIPNDVPYHITLDVDVLDPSVLDATGTPLPGGYSVPELVRLLTALGRSRCVVSMDVVELLPGPSDVPGVVVSDAILRTLAACHEATCGEGVVRQGPSDR